MVRGHAAQEPITRLLLAVLSSNTYVQNHIITNPSRFMYSDVVEYSTTEAAWNSYSYEYYLCCLPLSSLNQHLTSPRH
ncbi:hypothetical protein BD779DRAFT_76697 [Infundibulicybe gibba]|nr:hypothetical protein BD779DRAFT_76697 [Infundibulicybe gibba]